MNAKLVVVGTDKEYALANQDVLIGRSPDADVLLPLHDVFLSRKQARIETDGVHYYLVHMGSNPHTTKLQGEYVTEKVELQPGDCIELGSTTLQFVEGADAESSTQSGTSVDFGEGGEDELDEFEQVDSRDLEAGSSTVRDVLAGAGDEAAANIQSLFKATSELNPFAGEEVLLEKAFELLKDMLQFDSCAILLRDEDSGELRPKVVYPEAPAGGKTELSISRTVLRHVVENEVALFTSDIRSDEGFRSTMSVILKNIVSVMCVPLRAEKEILGIWYVDTRSPIRRYTRENLAFFGILSNFLARSILNLRLLKRVEQQAVFRNTIGRYFSPTIIQELERSADILHGQETQVAVMFTDVRSFSKISSQMQPRELLEWLNEHFTVVADAILEVDGTIDKYIGDSVMAFWGAPVPIEHASLRCVQAAVMIQQEMALLRQKQIAEGREPIHIKIGINTGPALAGNVGSDRRMDYSLISDAVNVADRLCSAAGEAGLDKIFISKATYDEVVDYFPGDIQELPPVDLKNIGEVVPYEVIYREKGE